MAFFLVRCEDCQGTGKYEGLAAIESCPACEGTGKVLIANKTTGGKPLCDSLCGIDTRDETLIPRAKRKFVARETAKLVELLARELGLPAHATLSRCWLELATSHFVLVFEQESSPIDDRAAAPTCVVGSRAASADGREPAQTLREAGD